MMLRADESMQADEFGEETTLVPESTPANWPAIEESPAYDPRYPVTLDEFGVTPGFSHDPPKPPSEYVPVLKYLGLRHSQTHGRNVGRGEPLVTTSWLNRPFYVGGELGTLWLNRSVYENVGRDIDTIGGVFVGWDHDPYWGGELRFDWATPELINSEARDADRTDSLFTWSYSALYYPWGDSKWRPYWRAGIGDTRFDFPLDDGSRVDEWLLTFPFGVGVKYPFRRWLAARAELADHVAIGDHDLRTQNNLTLMFGLEWRFGAHPRSYWPWNPERHIW